MTDGVRFRSGITGFVLILAAVVLSACPDVPIYIPPQPITGEYSLLVLDSRQGVATGINAWCEVVGYVTVDTGYNQAFLWNPDQTPNLTDLGTLEGRWSEAYGINAKHEVVGVSEPPFTIPPLVGVYHGFYWTASGGMRDMGTLGGRNSAAYAINSFSRAVGYAETGNQTAQAFVWNPVQGMAAVPGSGPRTYAAAISDAGVVVGDTPGLGTPGSLDSWRAVGWNIFATEFQIANGLGGVGAKATGINARGIVVGEATDENGDAQGYLWNVLAGMTPIGTLGTCTDFTKVCSSAAAININNQVVGLAIAEDITEHAVLWQDGRLLDLNTVIPHASNWYFMNRAAAINDKGCIAGSGFLADGQGNTVQVPVLLLPVVIQTFTISPAEVIGGTPASATITLSGAAPMPISVLLRSAGLDQTVSMPESIMIPRDQNTITFPIQSQTPGANVQGTIHANFGGWELIAPLTVKPT